jgi:hypothetical protein
MAGLLDIFGTSGQDTMGLLGMSPEEVTRNRDDAQAQALYALAGRLFQGGRGGASIVEGLQQGQQAYRTAMQGSLQQQLQNAQIQEMLRKRQQEQAALMRQQGIEQEIAKKIMKQIKDLKLKVQASIKGDEVRIDGKKRDDLQDAMNIIRSTNFDIPLQFINFRE